jgi:hypothetical protein
MLLLFQLGRMPCGSQAPHADMCIALQATSR